MVQFGYCHGFRAGELWNKKYNILDFRCPDRFSNWKPFEYKTDDDIDDDDDDDCNVWW